MSAKVTTVTPGVDLLDALEEGDLVTRQLNRSVETRKTYATSVRQLHTHQLAHDRPSSVDEITPFHVRSYLVDVLERTSA